MDSQMKKGVVEMCLLQSVAQRESYGYQLIREMADLFPTLPERTVYAILRRLMEGKYTETFLKDAETAGAPRKYYRVTEKGRVRLAESLAVWREITAATVKLGLR